MNFNMKSMRFITRFPHGKYRGHLVTDVLEDDPSYLVWWNDEVDGHEIDPVVLRAAIQELD